MAVMNDLVVDTATMRETSSANAMRLSETAPCAKSYYEIRLHRMKISQRLSC
jgi:hypothetical protein